VQPLAGEWAIRRSAFEKLSVPVGYGVELSTLLDVHAAYGIDAIAQVDLGRRAHRHQSLYDLAAMATEILAVAGRRMTYVPGQLPDGSLQVESGTEFVTLRRMGEDRTWIDRDVAVNERPRADGIAR
jgi:glucosyl-3-phosphoglycerate synthase